MVLKAPVLFVIVLLNSLVATSAWSALRVEVSADRTAPRWIELSEPSPRTREYLLRYVRGDAAPAAAPAELSRVIAGARILRVESCEINAGRAIDCVRLRGPLYGRAPGAM